MRAGIVGLFREHEAAGARQGSVAVGAELRSGPVHEFIDIAMVVREQDEALEVFRAGARIVCKTRQAEVGPQAVEKGEGDGLVRLAEDYTVGQFVPDVGQFGRGEMTGDEVGIDTDEFRTGFAIEDVGEGDFLA